MICSLRSQRGRRGGEEAKETEAKMTDEMVEARGIRPKQSRWIAR